MARVHPLTFESAPEQSQPLLNAVKKKFGRVPNALATMAHAPVALDAYLQLSGAVSKGQLTAKQREQISLAVAQLNECDYCLASHSTVGKLVGLTQDEIRDARFGTASDMETATLLQFVRKMVIQRGQVTDDDVAEFRDAGFDDGAVAEVVANVALSIFTNYFNQVTDTGIDFPQAEQLEVVYS